VKKILGFILSITGVIIFLSLYFLTILFKESENIALIIMGVGYIGVIIFIIGVMLIRKKNSGKEKRSKRIIV
jgi:uncharacterized protein with PQ loop repeat